MPNSTTAHTSYLFLFPGSCNDTGKLSFWENVELFSKGIQRCFWITEVGSESTRGNHAHWEESQVLVAIVGKLSIKVTNTKGEVYLYELEEPKQGLFVPPLHWVEVHFGPNSVLLGMSDRAFSEDDYIRDKIYFENLHKKNK